MRAIDPEERLGPVNQVLPDVLAEPDARESDIVEAALFGEEEASKEPIRGPVMGEMAGWRVGLIVASPAGFPPATTDERTG